MKKCVLLRADRSLGDKETARLLALELAERHVLVVEDEGDADCPFGVIVFVASSPSVAILSEMERASGERRCPVLCCAKEGDEPLPTGVIRIERPFSITRFCDSLSQTVQEGKTEILLEAAAVSLPLLDRQSGTVSYRGETVSLTKTEAALLALLLDKNGEPVSRQEALAAVWSSQASEDTNLVDVYIRYLRQKLDEHFDMRLIRTARGKGYYIKL